MGLFGRGKKRAGHANAPVNATGEDPVIGSLPAGQGGYTAAPYHHPWTGNLVRHPAGLLNPPMNAFSSYALGFQKPFTPYHRGVTSINQVMQTAFANGFALQGQIELTPLADFASSTPTEGS